MQRDIEVKLLRTLLTVVDEDGFSRAAQSLHVTQPTVSQQIQRLESLIQAPLFHRTKRPLRLTPAGQELVAHARRVLMLNSEVLDKLSAIRSHETFGMGCSFHFADGLSTMLSRLAEEQPHLRCATVTGVSASLADRVAGDELEAALLLGTRTARSEMLGRLRLGWFGHRALTPGGRVPISLLGDRSALSLHIVEALTAHGVPWYSLPWCTDPLAVRASVQAGLAYTALCENAQHKHPDLHPAPRGVLGPAPAPLPVYLAFSPTVRESVADAARAAARAILEGTPLSPP
ncbi:LysR family transcriptional regulator [Streptomyces griseus]|uniref:LysR family transcriptional regulator n=1 Tax=Streptomyces griseus TaxID=1911 RepID=UPI0004CB2103|nr:LysR family transcriptional regulator [Streptomyces griseus]